MIPRCVILTCVPCGQDDTLSGPCRPVFPEDVPRNAMPCPRGLPTAKKTAQDVVVSVVKAPSLGFDCLVDIEVDLDRFVA